MKLAVRSTPAQEVYQQYVHALGALKSWEATHQDLLDQYATLKAQVAETETALKTWAHTKKESLHGPEVSVLFQTPRRRWYDVGVLRASLSADLIQAVGLIEVEERVNEKALKLLVTVGKCPESLMEAAYREEALAPRVILKRHETALTQEE